MDTGDTDDRAAGVGDANAKDFDELLSAQADRAGSVAAERLADTEWTAAWILSIALADAHGITAEQARAGVRSDEWMDEGEQWGVALNGTPDERMWFGPIYMSPTNATRSIDFPRGAAIIGVDNAAIAAVLPQNEAWYVESEAVDAWRAGTLYALHDRLTSLGVDLPSAETVVRRADGQDFARHEIDTHREDPDPDGRRSRYIGDARSESGTDEGGDEGGDGGDGGDGE